MPITVVAALADRSVVNRRLDGAAGLAQVPAVRKTTIPGGGRDFTVAGNDLVRLKRGLAVVPPFICSGPSTSVNVSDASTVWSPGLTAGQPPLAPTRL